MNGSDAAERRMSMYRKVLKALDEAVSCLERIPAEGRDEDDAERSGAFHLGSAGGLAFADFLPGIESEALFDDISDAAEERDPGQVDRIRRSVAARLRSDPSPSERAGGESGLDWEAGFLQMLAALNEARRAWREGDRFRHSLMLGFLAGHLRGCWHREYRLGPLSDAVIAVHDRSPRRAARWVEAESIDEDHLVLAVTERDRAETGMDGPEAADARALLLRWLGHRLAAAHRFSEPLWVRVEGETEDQRRRREASERAYFEREESSIRRAGNFGKRIHAEDKEEISVPMGYALNRALVLQSHKGGGLAIDG